MSLRDRFTRKKNRSYYAEYLPDDSGMRRLSPTGPNRTMFRIRVLTGSGDGFSEVYQIDIPKVAPRGSRIGDIFSPIEQGDRSWMEDAGLKNLPFFNKLNRTTLMRYNPQTLRAWEAVNSELVYRGNRSLPVKEAEKSEVDLEESLLDPMDRSGSTSYTGLPAITEGDGTDIPIK